MPDSYTLFAEPEAPEKSPVRRLAELLAVVGIHGLLLALIVTATLRPDIQQSLATLSVRMIELAPPKKEIIQPQPKPTVPPAPRPKTQTPPPPVMATMPTVASPSSFNVAPQAPPKQPEAVQAPSTPPAPVIAPRFDANYLQNPKPAYPAMSRRLGEEGRVVLKVKVSPQGLPLSVEIKQSSNFTRLDEAARAAVEHWRFVPAKQGNEPVEAWVLVPLLFSLDS